MCNALGRTTAEVLGKLDAGHVAVSPSPLDHAPDTVVGAVPGTLDPVTGSLAKYDCRLARLAMLAADGVRVQVERARAKWGADRVAIVLGTSTGGLEETEQAYAQWAKDRTLPAAYDVRTQHDFAAVTDLYAEHFDVHGPRWVVSTACSSSGKVLGVAQRLIAAGLADAVLVGGIDSLCRMTLRGFRGLGILSTRPARPFAQERDGIHIGEGAALLLVERTGDAPVWLLGVGESADAYHMSSPDPEGSGARASMERALAQAGVAPSGVDLVVAHGTATKLNDESEAKGIAHVFGDRVPVCSTKGATGHLLGAAGATGIVFGAHAIRGGRLPGTVGSEPVDPEIAARIRVSAPGAARVERVIVSAFAFGGSNVSVLLGGPGSSVSAGAAP